MQLRRLYDVDYRRLFGGVSTGVVDSGGGLYRGGAE